MLWRPEAPSFVAGQLKRGIDSCSVIGDGEGAGRTPSRGIAASSVRRSASKTRRTRFRAQVRRPASGKHEVCRFVGARQRGHHHP